MATILMKVTSLCVEGHQLLCTSEQDFEGLVLTQFSLSQLWELKPTGGTSLLRHYLVMPSETPVPTRCGFQHC